MSSKLLVFTKNKAVEPMLQKGLEKRDIGVAVTGNKKKLLTLASNSRVDFLLIDSSDSVEKGLELCRQLRGHNLHAHIILVTPKGIKPKSPDIDFFLSAPVTSRKVLYRINLLRKASSLYQVVIGTVSLDVKNRVVRCDHHENAETKLTPKETLLLQLLMQRAGRLVSRKEIMKHVWSTEYLGDTRTIDVHIRWLRRKIESHPSRPELIRTVRGQGYRFEMPTVNQ